MKLWRKKRNHDSETPSHSTKQPRGRAMSRLEFSTLQYGIQSSVLKKLTFKDFIAFQKSSHSALSLCKKNQFFKFPFELQNLAISGNATFCINYDTKERSFTEIDDQVMFTAHTCIDYNSRPFSDERYNFYTTKIKKIGLLRCFPASDYDPKFAKILTAFPINELLVSQCQDVYYETNKINKVTIMASGFLSSEEAFDVKAKEELLVSHVSITPNDVVQHVKGLMSASNFPKKTFVIKNTFEVEELIAVIDEFGDKTAYSIDPKKGTHTWTIARRGETEPFLDLTYKMNGIIFDNHKKR